MSAPILLTGGTGTLGRLVLPRLHAAWPAVRVLSRRPHDDLPGITYVRGDMATGEGLDAALDGVETVLHLAGNAKGDTVAAQVLVDHAHRAGVQHLVAISVVAADAVPYRYFREQAGMERVIAAAQVPWTVLRAAQFHDFVLAFVQKLAVLPVVPVPNMYAQSVDADEVAERLVNLTLAAPAGRVADLVGPEEFAVADAARTYLTARGSRRRVVPAWLPGKMGRAYRERANLAVDGVTRGERTWAAFLADRVTVP